MSALGAGEAETQGPVPLQPCSPERGVGPAPKQSLELLRKVVACPPLSPTFPYVKLHISRRVAEHAGVPLMEQKQED